MEFSFGNSFGLRSVGDGSALRTMTGFLRSLAQWWAAQDGCDFRVGACRRRCSSLGGRDSSAPDRARSGFLAYLSVRDALEKARREPAAAHRAGGGGCVQDQS
jgi:hypothetical protein